MDEWQELKVPREEVEISTVLACGQSFRWKNNGSSSLEWIGVFGHHLWILKQNETSISYKVITSEKSTTFTNGSKSPTDNSSSVSTSTLLKKPVEKEHFDHLLRQYFQLDITLPSLYKRWAEKDKKFASLTIKDYQGIRMLAQDPIENLFSFICSSNNNIQRISQMVEKLCLNYGNKIADYNGKSYFDFPEVEKLIGEKVEKKLREESFGYRAGFISKSAEKIVEKGGAKWVENLKTVGYEEARVELQTLPGIGRKVADCICLMSLGYPEAIPVDTHIHQVAKEYLPHLAKVKTLTEKVYSEITDYFRSMYGDYAGWAHSVLFASTLRHLKTEGNKKASKKSRKPDNIKSKVQLEDTNELNKNGRDTVELSNKMDVKVVNSSPKVPISADKDVVVRGNPKRKLKIELNCTGSERRSKRMKKN